MRASIRRKSAAAEESNSLYEAIDLTDEKATELIALDDALKALAEFDPQKSKIVELRFFGGLSIKETAAVLNVGTATIIRQWKMAKAWLYHEVSQKSDESEMNYEF